MSLRHRWLAVSLVFTVSILPFQGAVRSEERGAVGLRELIVLALRNDPQLVSLRNEISIEEARKKATVQWRDPELRLGLSRDDNIQLDQPFTRSGTTSESFSSRQNASESGGPNGAATSNEVINGTRTTSFTEQVTPGANSDRIIRNETERLQTQTNSRDSDSRGTFGRKGSESEVFRSTTDETVFHGRDRLARDQTASVRVRFWIPKPAEMKARIDMAARRVDLANYQISAAERGVILEIREQYEELQFLSRKLEASRRQIEIIEGHSANQKELLDAGGAFTLDKLSFEDLKIPGLELAVDAAETELAAAKRSLAARVGLTDGSRIRLNDSLLRSGISLQETDLDYLTLMAFAHRGEVGVLKHETAIAESELEVVKTRRIPWFSFLEAAYAKDSTGSVHTNDNYGVQLGVILPIFSSIAKEEEVVEARLGSYYASLEANQKSIANEVAEAFESVKEASRHRSNTRAAIQKHATTIEERAKGLDASEDLAAQEQLRYDAEMELSKIHEYRLSADRLFNQSLIRLERALGADLDQVMNVEYLSLDPSLGGGPASPVDRSAPAKPDSEVIRATPVRPGPVPEASARQSVGGEPAKRKGLFQLLKNPEE